MEATRMLATGVLFMVTWTASHQAYVCGGSGLPCASGLHRASNKPKKQNPKTKFWDHQKEPIPTIIVGEKATQIERHMTTLFVPCRVSERKQAEKGLVELVSTYKLPESSVEAGATWSSPLNFAAPRDRRVVIAFLHSGTGHYISLWVLHEHEDKVKSFSFKGSAKGCGSWQVCNDLDGNGNAEIIIKHFVGDYDGAGTIAVWPAIYKWNGNNYVRADDEFPEYYAQEVVPKYQKILEERKDWENHRHELIRQVYEKCKFILQKAESIAKKTKPRS